MKRIGIFLLLLVLASLACTLTSDNDNVDDPRTPTPIKISDAEATATRVSVTNTPSLNSTPTPISAPPTLRPTLLPTPQQFNTPVPVSGGQVTTGGQSGAAVVADASGGFSSSGNAAASGAPQANGFYYPSTIVFASGDSVRSVGRDGSAGGVISSGNRLVRSLNGLFVASVSGSINIVRPDGTSISQGSGMTTLPSWSGDGNTAAYGSGSTLMLNGQPADSVNGNLIAVEYAPDGGTILFASDSQIKLRYGDGNIGIVWDSMGERINIGPYWAYRNDQLGVYIETSGGKKLFIGGGVTEITNPFEHLQLRSPANGAGRVYVRARNAGSLTLVASYPGGSDIEFTAPTLQDVSWSPDGSQLVYASLSGDLVLLDAATGSQQVIAAGVGARFPIWSPPRYLLRD